MTDYTVAASFLPCIHHFCPETLHFPSPPREHIPTPCLWLDQGLRPSGTVAHTVPSEGSECPSRHQETLLGESRGTPLAPQTSHRSADASEHTVRPAQLGKPPQMCKLSHCSPSQVTDMCVVVRLHRNGPREPGDHSPLFFTYCLPVCLFLDHQNGGFKRGRAFAYFLLHFLILIKGLTL